MVSNQFNQWGKGYTGLDGGDIGSPDSPSLWLCGIEWGGSTSHESLQVSLTQDQSQPPTGYDDWRLNTAYPYNWNAMKLLSVMDGGRVSDYKAFAERVKPFVKGTPGFFKLNLYPIGFTNTNPALWVNDFASLTGHETKYDYIKWCRDHRFPEMRSWAAKHRPKVILCTGKTYFDDFHQAFGDSDNDIHHEIIDGHDIKWFRNHDGTLVVVIPFMLNRYGLVQNTSIQLVGDRIKALM